MPKFNIARISREISFVKYCDHSPVDSHGKPTKEPWKLFLSLWLLCLRGVSHQMMSTCPEHCLFFHINIGFIIKIFMPDRKALKLPESLQKLHGFLRKDGCRRDFSGAEKAKTELFLFGIEGSQSEPYPNVYLVCPYSAKFGKPGINSLL